MKIIQNVLFLVVGVLFIQCSSDDTLDSNLQKLGRATGPIAPSVQQKSRKMPPVSSGTPTKAPSGKLHRGKIVESIQVTQYTYLHLSSENGQKTWAAVPKTNVTNGEEVTVIESLVMKDFTSPTLNRTFPQIVFGVLNRQNKEAMKQQQPKDHPTPETDSPTKEKTPSSAPADV